MLLTGAEIALIATAVLCLASHRPWMTFVGVGAAVVALVLVVPARARATSARGRAHGRSRHRVRVVHRIGGRCRH